MGTPKLPLRADPIALDWQQVEEMLNQLERVSKSAGNKSASDADEYYRGLLDRVTQSLGAAGGAIWIAQGGDALRLACQRDQADCAAA